MSFGMFELHLHYRWRRRCWHLFVREANWCHFFKIKIAPKLENALFFVALIFFLLSLFLYLHCRNRYLAQKNMSEKWMQSSSAWAKNIYIYKMCVVFMLFPFLVHLRSFQFQFHRNTYKCKWKNIIIIVIILSWRQQKYICAAHAPKLWNEKWERAGKKMKRKWLERNYHTNVVQWIKRKNGNK